jgi:type I restriction enzyme, S subunit
MSTLPNSWRLATLEELVAVNPAGSETVVDDEDPVTFLPMAAVEELTGKIDTADTRPFVQVKKGYTRFRNGDLLFAKITPCMENGKIAVAADLKNGVGCGSTEFHVLRPDPMTDINYVRYFVLQEQFRNGAKRNMSGAVGQQRVPAEFLRQHTIPQPPPQEQRRIVSKIDELFSRINAGEAALKRAKALVERYRKSILKAAVTGELTKEWREKNKDKIEPADQLLKRILKARREAWESAELAKMKAKGKPPKDDAWKRKYTEPTTPDTSELPDLPEGWVWASLNQLSWATSYGTSSKCGYETKGVAVLRIPNVRSGTANLDDLKYATSELEVEVGDLIRPFDLLIVRTNGSAELIGVGSVVEKELPLECYFASYLIRFRLIPKSSLASWVNMIWQTQQVRDFVYSNAATSAGQYNISQSKLAGLCIPIPPFEEMALADGVVFERMQSIDQHITSANRIDGVVPRLRQSVLQSAFTGKLVPQNPEDQPATVLLERIRNTSPVIKPKKTKRGK